MIPCVLLHLLIYKYYRLKGCVSDDLSNPDTNGTEESVIVNEVSSFLNACKSGIYLGGGGGGGGEVLFREVSSIRECPYRERGFTVYPLSLPGTQQEGTEDDGEGEQED